MSLASPFFVTPVDRRGKPRPYPGSRVAGICTYQNGEWVAANVNKHVSYVFELPTKDTEIPPIVVPGALPEYFGKIRIDGNEKWWEVGRREDSSTIVLKNPRDGFRLERRNEYEAQALRLVLKEYEDSVWADLLRERLAVLNQGS